MEQGSHALTRLRRLRDLLGAGRSVDGWQGHAALDDAIGEIDRLRELLNRCRPIIEADAQMMADISRHAPLDAASQAVHDSTEYESERLLRDMAPSVDIDKL